MKKKTIIIVILIMLALGAVSLYTTYALNEENLELENSNADYNLTYSALKDNSQKITVSSKEEKYIDIDLTNIYESTVKYGMYYYLISPKEMPDGVEIKLASFSKNVLEDIIKPNESKTISIRITNNSDYTINLVVGALIGYEHGNIADLISDGEVLIK